MQYQNQNQQQIAQIAQNIAKNCQKDQIILLKGDLGVGKTFFTQNFINYFDKKDICVTSPTFNIVHSYQFGEQIINHFDLYRIKDSEELENIGFIELLCQGISLIEWPQIVENYLQHKKPLNIEINYANESNLRNVTII